MPFRSPLPRASMPARILIAEDHLDSRAALSALLEAIGFEVVQAANGREAVDLAIAEAPDLVLMDMMMPEMDGFEATRAMRAHPLLDKIPIIAVTAMEGAQTIAFGSGVSDYVAKPVDTRLLINKIEQLLQQQRA
jgi:two-component system, cell cycle response regulator DivK